MTERELALIKSATKKLADYGQGIQGPLLWETTDEATRAEARRRNIFKRRMEAVYSTLADAIDAGREFLEQEELDKLEQAAESAGFVLGNYFPPDC